MGGGAGVGSDSGGARALFAPKPVIPDDLREQAFHTVAVAHFRVSYDGEVQVTLTRPTESPRLNELLLEALKQWRFFPAMRNGVAIDSQFDVRIPISVQ
jgi:protein TonB